MKTKEFKLEYFPHHEIYEGIFWVLLDGDCNPWLWGEISDFRLSPDDYYLKYATKIQEIESVNHRICGYQQIIDVILLLPKEQRDNQLISNIEWLLKKYQEIQAAIRVRTMKLFTIAQKLRRLENGAQNQ